MIDRVTLYRAPTTVADVDRVATWLDSTVEASVSAADRFLDVHRDDSLPRAFAEARVLSPYDRRTGNTMLGTIRYEERMLDQPEREGGVLYDASSLQPRFNALLPPEERSLSHLHIAVLDRAIATWGDHDGRWHKRISSLGQPAILSVPGIYEAPAKPEEYYKEQQRHALLSGDTPPREVLESKVDGTFLIENDPRTTDVLKGYALQAVDYIETGQAFCDEPTCRLYNAHYHEELVQAQLEDPAFCHRHDAMYG